MSKLANTDTEPPYTNSVFCHKFDDFKVTVEAVYW